MSGSGPASLHAVGAGCTPGDPIKKRVYPFDLIYGWFPEGRDCYVKWHTCLRGQPGWLTDIPVAHECVAKASNSSWWLWGSLEMGTKVMVWVGQRQSATLPNPRLVSVHSSPKAIQARDIETTGKEQGR